MTRHPSPRGGETEGTDAEGRPAAGGVPSPIASPPSPVASATVLLRKDKTDDSGRAPLRLRFRHRGHPDASLSLQLKAPADRWDAERQRVAGRSQEAQHVNAALADAEAAARDAVLRFRSEQRPPLPRDVRDAVGEALALGRRQPDAPADDVLEHYARWVESNRLRGGAAAWFRRRAGMNRFEAFLAHRGHEGPLAWEQLTTSLVRAYRAWLMTPTGEGGAGNAESTATGRIKELRTFCRQAVGDGTIDRDPTAPVRLSEPRSERRVLSADEVAALVEAGASHERPHVRLAVDLWAFSYHAGGARFGDVVTLPRSAVTETDDGRVLVVYHQAKTGKPVAHLLPEAGAEIARRYLHGAGGDGGPATDLLFPVCRPSELDDPVRRRREVGRANARTNKALKVAAKTAGIEPFSFHSARHSFASGRVSAGADLRAVQKALNHSTLAQTARYVADLGADVLDLDAL